LALPTFHIDRAFTPPGATSGAPEWVWTMPCGETLVAVLETDSGLDPECYQVAPHRLVVPEIVGVLGLAAIVVGLAGARSSSPVEPNDGTSAPGLVGGAGGAPASGSTPVSWRRVRVIVACAAVLVVLVAAAPSLVDRGPP